MANLKPLVFADLDDTLFQTRRKMDEGQIFRQAAIAANGNPRKSSFMTQSQSGLFDWLNTSAELIPVTARSGDAFSRVDLPFNSWAIISNGAMILEPGGELHQPWAVKMLALLSPLARTMDQILTAGNAAAKAAGVDQRSWIVEEDGLATYVVFKLNVVTPESLSALENLTMPVDDTWTRHFNAETLALIPPGSGKAVAIDYLQNLINPDKSRPTLGFGDSRSDLNYMQKTNVLMIPASSQIAKSL